MSWTGQDDPGGSGIGSYNVYVSDNGSEFTLWQSATTATSATFTGQDGHTYGFYGVATDNVGNVQPTPPSPQAYTTVNTATTATVNLTWSGPGNVLSLTEDTPGATPAITISEPSPNVSC